MQKQSKEVCEGIKAVVFDFDDTIVESEKWKKKIFYFVIKADIVPKIVA